MRTKKQTVYGYTCAGVIFLFTLLITFICITAHNTKLIEIYDSSNIIYVSVADTPELRIKGLSGHEPLNTSEGMLFVFDVSSVDNCFWMKDMSFPIDMVWLDENKQVVTVAPEVAPESYPRTFCPEHPAKYGLELASRQADSLGIKPTVKLTW